MYNRKSNAELNGYSENKHELFYPPNVEGGILKRQLRNKNLLALFF